jgi:hypothetical protein
MGTLLSQGFITNSKSKTKMGGMDDFQPHHQEKQRNSWWQLKPHCIRCSHFKVDDVSALEPSSKPPVRIVEDPGYGLDAVTR